MMDASPSTDLNLPGPGNGPMPGHAMTQQQPVQPQPISSNSQIPTSEPSDELDKEWISRAKHVVEQTKQDPFMQSREIGKIKADYLRVRFNKHISLGKDQTL